MEEVFIYILLGAALAVIIFGIGWLLLHRQPAGTDYPLRMAGPDFTEHAGFRMVQLPRDSIIKLDSSWAKSGRVGEMRFVIEPEWTATLRVGRTGCDLGLDEFESNYDGRATLNFEGIRVLHQQNPGGEALLQWSRQGFDYCLHFPETEQGMAAGLADDFVLETLMETSG